MDTSAEELRENIRLALIELRNKKGLTQSDIGELTGKGKTTVASWEQGKSLPDLVTLYHLALFYRVRMEYFYGEKNTYDFKVDLDKIERDVLEEVEKNRMKEEESCGVNLETVTPNTRKDIRIL